MNKVGMRHLPLLKKGTDKLWEKEMKKFRNEKGFTLIELIVVIVILGILSVIAVPKYLDLRADAEKGTAKGVTAALRGAVTIHHARYLMDNTQDYDAKIIANGIETEDITIVATASDAIEATFPSGNKYAWKYADRSGYTPAKVTEAW
jgi:prepilin-type N-terminal cleavage/methylation domain-containing protein